MWYKYEIGMATDTRAPSLRRGSAEVAHRVDDFVDLCGRLGIKATHQRREIFREVARTDEHPDAETIFGRVRKRIPAVSRDTVYRTLALLEEKGLLNRLELFSGRTRFDARVDRHHHFICTQCGLVRDFTSEAMDRLRAPKRVREWGDVQSTHIQLRGICRTCRAKAREKTNE